MVIVRIMGGLGNQMFQHAAGVALADRLQCELLWDLTAYDCPRAQRTFELDTVFGLQTPRADERAMRSVLGWRGHRTLRPWLTRDHLSLFRPARYVLEPHFQHWSGFTCLEDGSYLDGYWQSEYYFKHIAKRVREAFTFSPPLTRKNQLIADAIADSRSICLHIRRGDYISNAETNRAHGCCTLDYYHEAVQQLLHEIEGAHFFIFSDDPGWVVNNLRLPAACTYIAHNQGASSFIDLQLMSMCKHHIIANSTFSWWGAWLGKMPGQRVIAPGKWFGNPSIITRDLYCPGWNVL